MGLFFSPLYKEMTEFVQLLLNIPFPSLVKTYHCQILTSVVFEHI